MGFGKSKKSEVVEPNGHQNYGYIDDEVKFSNLKGGKDGVEANGKGVGKDEKKESEEEEKDKSSIFALVSFFDDFFEVLIIFFQFLFF